MASGRLLAGMGWTWPLSKRPMRGPITSRAASATQPPMLCTTVEPAKSTKPAAPSQPASPPSAPPQVQWPNTG